MFSCSTQILVGQVIVQGGEGGHVLAGLCMAFPESRDVGIGIALEAANDSWTPVGPHPVHYGYARIMRYPVV